MNDRDRFDKFTERARRVLNFAQEEAQHFQHNYIGTEHLLLGLVRESEGVAAKVLANLGINLSTVRSKVQFIIGRGDRIVLGEIGLTPRSKKCIEYAVDEARRLNHHYIGTEHLLLGLLREGQGIGAGVLESMGVDLAQVRVETLKVLGSGSPPTSSSSSQTVPQLSDESPRARTREKFTERARKVLSLAQEEAQRLQHNAIGSGHLLLGLVREGEGVAAKVLERLDVDLAKARNAVESITPRGDRIVLGEIGLTATAKKMVQYAAEEAHLLHHHYVGTEHLLLGIIRASNEHTEQDETIAADALASLGVNVEKIRVQAIQILNASHSRSTTTSSESLLIPPEAATLIPQGTPALPCTYCHANNLPYFRHCFNCGRPLTADS